MKTVRQIFYSLLAGLTLILLVASQTTAATLSVGPDGQYQTIQAAIDAAADGDIIQVAAGEYAGCLVIDKAIDLIGAGRDVTIIQADKGSKYNGGRTYEPVVMIDGDAALYQDVPLNISGAASVAGRKAVVFAAFGPAIGSEGWAVNGEIAYADDPLAEGPLQNVNGKIALIDRGTVSFNKKAVNAQNSGAIAVIIANNASALPAIMGADTSGPVTIPVLMVSQSDGDAIKSALDNHSLTASFLNEGHDPEGPGIKISGFTFNGMVPDSDYPFPSTGPYHIFPSTAEGLSIHGIITYDINDKNAFAPHRQNIVVSDNKFVYCNGVHLFTVTGFEVSNNIFVRETYKRNVGGQEVDTPWGGFITYLSNCKQGLVKNNEGYAPNMPSTLEIYSGAISAITVEDAVFDSNTIIAPEVPLAGDDGYSYAGIYIKVGKKLVVENNTIAGLLGGKPNSGKKGNGAALRLLACKEMRSATGNTFENNTIGIEVVYNWDFYETDTLFSITGNNLINNRINLLNCKWDSSMEEANFITPAEFDVIAPMNYWGTETGPDQFEVPASQTWEEFMAFINGAEGPLNAVSTGVTFVPFLTQETASGPVHNVTQDLYFDTIQAAIAAADDGDTIEVAAGTYAEDILIDKALVLLGPNADKAGFAADRVAEAILLPSELKLDLEGQYPGKDNSTIVTVDADNVTISGFTLCGDNPAIDGFDHAGMNVEIGNGITSQGSNIVIKNNIVDQFTKCGIKANGTQSTTWEGLVVEGNLISNIHDVNLSGYGMGIYVQGTAGTVTNNVIRDCRMGMQIQPYRIVNDTVLVSNNKIAAWFVGVWYNYSEEGASAWTISDNLFTASLTPEQMVAEFPWLAIRIETIRDTSNGALFKDNVIDGLAAFDDPFHTYDEYANAVWGAHYRYGSTCDKIIMVDNIFTNLSFGYVHSASVDVELANNTLYVRDAAIAIQPGPSGGINNVDATGGLLINGVDTTTATLEEFFAIEDLINHKVDNPAVGLVRIRENSLFVTPASGSIQRAIDAANDGDTIYLAGGTYLESPLLNKQVNIVGPDAEPKPLIAGTLKVTYAGSSPLLIENVNFTLEGTDVKDSMVLTGVQNLTVRGCDFDANDRFMTGTAATDARAIQIDGKTTGNISVDSCTFHDGYYVTIQGRAKSLSVKNSIIENCKSGINMQYAYDAGLSIENTLISVVVQSAENNTYCVRFGSGTGDAKNLHISACTLEVVNPENLTPTGDKEFAALILRAAASGQLEVSGTRFYGDVINSSANQLLSTHNFWGAAEGPSSEQLAGNASYSPWYEDPELKILRYLPGQDVDFTGEMIVGKNEVVIIPATFKAGSPNNPAIIRVLGGTLSIGAINLSANSIIEVIEGKLVLGTGAGDHTIAGTFTIYNSFGSIYVASDTEFSGDTLALISDIHVADGVVLTVSGSLTLDGCTVDCADENVPIEDGSFTIAVTETGEFTLVRTELSGATLTLAGNGTEIFNNLLSNVTITVLEDAANNRVFHNIFAAAVSLIDNGTDTITEVDGWGNVASANEVKNIMAAELQELDGRTLEEGNLYIQPGDAVTINLDAGALSRKVSSTAAMLGFNADYFDVENSSLVAVSPWEYELHKVLSNDGVFGKINTAIGLSMSYPDAVGIDTDTTPARITLQSRAEVEGMTRFYFRTAQEGEAETHFSAFDGENDYTLTPFTVNSGYIIVDGTDPEVLEGSFTGTQVQEGDDKNVFLANVTVQQGTVTFTVKAQDSLSGIIDTDVVMTIEHIDETTTLDATPGLPVVGEDGWTTYTFTTTIEAATPNGAYIASLTVTDRSGNTIEELGGTFVVQKNQALITVELQGVEVESLTREVVFTATFADGSTPVVWVRELIFSAGTGSTTILEVPDGIVSISAKTAHTLSRKLYPVQVDGQFTADFTDDLMLLGGDLNGDDVVDDLDFNRLRFYWYTKSDIADITGDGEVGTGDLNLLKANFYKVGDSF